MFALTPRLLLRPGWPEDATALARAIGHEEVVTRLARVPWPYAESDAHRFLGDHWASPGPVFLIIERKGDGRPIGGVGLHDGEILPELGYWLTPSAWGRGYATEAARAVVAVARDALRVPRLRATAFEGNDASARVLAKLGFRPTGRTMRMACLALGRDVDAVETTLDLRGPATARAA